MYRNKAIVLIVMMSVVLCGLFYVSDSASAASPEIASVLSQPPASDIGKKTVCAYCGMHLTVKPNTPAATYDGKDYYFCDDTERDAFVKAPKQYLSKQPSAGITSAAKTSP
jgi:YHS domain-containing protein